MHPFTEQHCSLGLFPYFSHLLGSAMWFGKGNLGSRLLVTVSNLKKFKFPNNERCRHRLYIICNKVKSLSHVQLFVTPWTIAYQAPPSMGFSRQEYWSGLPFPPGDLPDPGIEPGSPTFQADALTSEPPGNPNKQQRKPIFVSNLV